MTTSPNPNHAERFWRKVDTAGTCWRWKASISPDGYGRFCLDGGMKLAHRVSYELLVGPIPEGAVLDHLCRNRGCVNPAHLEAVTQAVNLLRSPLMGEANKRKTHCPAGHPYDDANTRKSGARRHCRACDSARPYDSDRWNPIKDCPDCGKSMRRNNFARHRAAMHKPAARLDLTQDVTP